MGQQRHVHLLGLFALGLVIYPLGVDPSQVGVTALIWLSLWAAPAGALAAGRGLVAWLIPVGWILCLVPPVAGWVSGGDGAGLERAYGGLVLAGLFGVGWGLSRAWPRRSLTWASILMLLGLSLAALPSLAGLGAPAPWSPALSARFLDLSPASLVLECAGFDWMRHPAVYTPAGADSIDPLLRLPWRGGLAGPLTLLLGCLVSWMGIQWEARSTH